LRVGHLQLLLSKSARDLFDLFGGDGFDVHPPRLLAITLEHVLDAFDEAAPTGPSDGTKGSCDLLIKPGLTQDPLRDFGAYFGSLRSAFAV
jgi:hypothetical protein